MLNALHKLALHLKPWRKVVIGLLLISISVMIAELFFAFTEQDDLLLLPAIIASIWFAVLVVLSKAFAQIPQCSQQASWWQKQKYKLHRFAYWILAILFLGCGLAFVFVSFRAIRVWLSY